MRRNLDLVIRLQRAGSFQMSVFAAVMGFLVYSSMYAFRKPFAVGTFEGETFLGLDLKVWLILAQTLGYMASKFYGIKMISELKEKGRAWLIVGLIGISWLGLLGFAILPAPVPSRARCHAAPPARQRPPAPATAARRGPGLPVRAWERPPSSVSSCPP